MPAAAERLVARLPRQGRACGRICPRPSRLCRIGPPRLAPAARFPLPRLPRASHGPGFGQEGQGSSFRRRPY
eukprot:2476226-Lingulodinium_polyedra.AAC.1